MPIKHAKTAIPDVDKVDCTDWNASHIVDNQHIIPVGSLFMYGAAAAPTGWLLCNGAAVSRTTYAALFAVIGTTYGVGDGSTTFNLPNFASKFPRGNVAGDTGGSDDAVVVEHNHTAGNQSVSHNHTFTGNALGTHGHEVKTTFGAGFDHTWVKMVFASGTVIGGVASKVYQTSRFIAEAISAGTPSGSIGNQSASHTHSINNAGVSGTNANIPAFLGVNFIIKY